MKKLALALAATAASMAIAPAVSAAPTITIVTGSGTFGNDNLTCATTAPCTFNDVLTFTTPTGYTLTSASITSNMVTGDNTTNVDFSSVQLNGADFTILSTGAHENRYLDDQPLTAGGTNTLTISGTTGGNASYGGTLTFSAMTAVPEPAAWALMILGFGVVGYAMRRRPTARFANAC